MDAKWYCVSELALTIHAERGNLRKEMNYVTACFTRATLLRTPQLPIFPSFPLSLSLSLYSVFCTRTQRAPVSHLICSTYFFFPSSPLIHIPPKTSLTTTTGKYCLALPLRAFRKRCLLAFSVPFFFCCCLYSIISLFFFLSIAASGFLSKEKFNPLEELAQTQRTLPSLFRVTFIINSLFTFSG